MVGRQSSLDDNGDCDGTDEPVEMDPTHRYSRQDQILGRGASKTVYRAFDTLNGIEVAWNQVRLTDLATSPADRAHLNAEISLLKRLKHKNVMSLHDSWVDPKTRTVNFVTELLSGGSLRTYRARHKLVDDATIARWAWQILQGITYLHGHTPKILHRDLNLSNIFICGTTGTVKIGDLGLATLCQGLAPRSIIGTPEFMAPELFESVYDEKVDIYAFGMCLLELVTMAYPYSECSNVGQIYKKVSNGVLPASFTTLPPSTARDLIELCIRYDPNTRPEARELLKHTYFHAFHTPEKFKRPPLSIDVSCGNVIHIDVDVVVNVRVAGLSLASGASAGTIEFDVCLSSDTPDRIAHELVRDLAMSVEDAHTVARRVVDEVRHQVNSNLDLRPRHCDV